MATIAAAAVGLVAVEAGAIGTENAVQAQAASSVTDILKNKFDLTAFIPSMLTYFGLQALVGTVVETTIVPIIQAMYPGATVLADVARSLPSIVTTLQGTYSVGKAVLNLRRSRKLLDEKRLRVYEAHERDLIGFPKKSCV